MKRALAAVAALGFAAAGCTRDVSLPPPVPQSIAGRVVYEQPGTGAVSPAGNARLEFVGTGIAVQSDGQTGRFQFSQVPPAPRTLWVQWSSDGSGSYDRQISLKGGLLDGSGAIELGDIEVAPNAQVRGRVLLADQPADSPDQAGTVVYVQHYPYAGISAPGGAFELTSLPPGQVSIGLFHPGYAVGSVQSITLVAGGTLTLADVLLSPESDGGTGPSGIQGSTLRQDGSAASGVALSVLAAATTGAPPVATATSSSTGSFSVPVAPGVYDLVADDGSGHRATVGGVFVPPAQTTDVGALTLTAVPSGAPSPQQTPPFPVASVGNDQTVLPGQSVLLNGLASTGEQLTFYWSQDGGTPVEFGANATTEAALTNFIAPATPQVLSFSLTVEDLFGQRSAPATTRVFVDSAPTASLSATPSSAATGTKITLDASGSADGDGDSLTYAISEVQGPPVTLTASSNGASATFTPTTPGAYLFQATVSDGHFQATSSVITVTIANANQPPTVTATVLNGTTAGAPIAPGDQAVMVGQGSDPDPNESLTFTWQALNGGPVPSCVTTDCSTAQITAPATTATYTYQLTATDNGTPPLSGSAIVNVPVVTGVVSTAPANGASGVSPLSSITLTYSALLDPASVPANAVSVFANDAGIPGTSRYASDTSGHGQVIWSPQTQLPTGAVVSATYSSFADTNNQATPAGAIQFSTRLPLWTDHSPVDPNYLDPVSNAPVDYSFYPFGPSLVTGAGATYLGYTEFWSGSTSEGAVYLAQWNSAKQQWAYFYSYGPNNGAPDTNMWSLGNGTSCLYRQTQRTYLGVDPAGYPLIVYDQTAGCYLTYWPYQNAPYWQTATYIAGMGTALANDGTSSWMVERACVDNLSESLSVKPLTTSTPTSTLTWGAPGNSSCTSLSSPTIGQPTMVFDTGSLYVAASHQTGPDAGFVMDLFLQPTPGAAFGSIADGGQLNVAAVDGNSVAELAAAPKGPVLVFTEGLGSGRQLRALRYDIASGATVDPLYDLVGSAPSSVIAPALPDGSTIESPDDPQAVVKAGIPYVAFIATNSANNGERVYVAHADTLQHQWILDADAANGDGALNKHAGCHPTTVSIALMDGLPTVAWGESCPIANQPSNPPLAVHTQNFLIVKRLE